MQNIFQKFKKRGRKEIEVSSGFTIIETMIAITIFLIVVMIGTTAILNAYSIGNKSKGMRSIMDNLNFIVEDMSRNIRTGYHYECINNLNQINETPKSCKDGAGLAFESSNGKEGDPSDQWVYYINGDNLFKSIAGGGDSAPIQLNPDEVSITNKKGGFSVLGAEGFPPDSQQPFVIIRLAGEITYKNTKTSFSIQTAISQRTNDLEEKI